MIKVWTWTYYCKWSEYLAQSPADQTKHRPQHGDK